MPSPIASVLGAASAASSALPLAKAQGALSPNKVRELAEEFESVFLKDMLEEMFAGVADGDPFGNTEGADAWRSIQVEEFGRAISRAGGIGIADYVQRELIALQESQS